MIQGKSAKFARVIKMWILVHACAVIINIILLVAPVLLMMTTFAFVVKIIMNIIAKQYVVKESFQIQTIAYAHLAMIYARQVVNHAVMEMIYNRYQLDVNLVLA